MTNYSLKVKKLSQHYTHHCYTDINPSTMTRILICGDGNFSFSLSIGRLIKNGDAQLLEELVGCPGPFEITCTSFDTRAQLLGKYQECEQILPQLDRMGAEGITVEHGINAWELETHYPETRFDVVLWNHPHLGTENFNLHRFLLTHFMFSARQVLKEQGFILLSVLSGQSMRWAIEDQAQKIGLHLARKANFLPSQYPGYETRRNRTGGSFQNTHTQHHTGDALKSISLRFSNKPCDAQNTSIIAVGDTPAPEKIARKPAQNEFFCDLCGKGFKKAQGVFTHKKQVHEMKKYGNDWKIAGQDLSCDVCAKKGFPCDDALWQHKIATHTEDVNIPHPSRDGDVQLTPEEAAKTYDYYPCEICGMSVSSHPDWGMSAHLESLKPIVGLELPCGQPNCDKVFIEQRALRQHRNFCRRSQQPEQRTPYNTPLLLTLFGAAVVGCIMLSRK